MRSEVPDVFSADEARAYWDERHATAGSLQSGGHIRHSDAEAALLYAVRIARVAEALGQRVSPAHPLHLLDAGCGKGHFAKALAGFGLTEADAGSDAASLPVRRSCVGRRALSRDGRWHLGGDRPKSGLVDQARWARSPGRPPGRRRPNVEPVPTDPFRAALPVALGVLRRRVARVHPQRLSP